MSKDKYFTEGFFYKGLRFGWKNKKLWRLPITRDGRTYKIKQVPKIKDISYGNASKPIEGFHIARDKKSLQQVRALTKPVKYFVGKAVNCTECA